MRLHPPTPFVCLALALAACSSDPHFLLEDEEPITGPRCAVELQEVAAYQTVKVTLSRGDRALPSNADLVARKPALLRVFLAPSGEVPAPRVTVALTIDSGQGPRRRESSGTVSGPSLEEVAGSTFDFPISAAELTPTARLSVEIQEPAGCTGLPRTRFPRDGVHEMHPQPIGPLRIRVVPLRYQADRSGRLPDVSEEQLAALRDALLAMFPVPAVEISVRDPASTSVAVSPWAGWRDLMDGVRELRARDRPPADVYYLGMVAPATSFATYCGASCTLGLSFAPRADEAKKRVSVGLGYSGRFFIEAMLHELGHAHGRRHAPCGNISQLDHSFPYPQAQIGVWGYDIRSAEPLRSPSITRDIMSTCGPRWVSDYTYRGLMIRSAQVNARSF